ncbi:methyltransferase domain-containing protein [Fluviicola taffensis]|uniref:Methyltransferase type 11 n=1 Tax=Fluviicola taffensis (strain DSM 16823 / NCIMB 13979 / RW262) TaxID=755732 RepID=F2IGC4_FLUTR|nr:methyltransferase domain-containing protein [Fluviicola taffensis]AEA45790.1 Methyltransferase type 11 [Fluviicola taffensis DSM 16823]
MTDYQLLKEIIQWDIKSWSKALLFWEKNVDWNQVENGLELGGREGGLSLWLALKGKTTLCTDLNNIKETAEKLHVKHQVTALISYENLDAAAIPYENHFDVIVFKSIIGGIGRNDNFEIQKKVFKEIYKALKPGGKLLFAENLIGSQVHKKLRVRYANWGSPWRYLSISEMEECLSIFSSYELKTTGFLATLGRGEKQRKFFAAIDQLFWNHVTPSKWKYIAYGVAQK